MPFKIQQQDVHQDWVDCWIYPQPKHYKDWIREFESLVKEYPNGKFRLVRYVFEIRLNS